MSMDYVYRPASNILVNMSASLAPECNDVKECVPSYVTSLAVDNTDARTL